MYTGVRYAKNYRCDRISTQISPFLEGVVRKGTSLILTLDSRPEAVLIPYEDFLRFQQMQESEVSARFDKVWDRSAEINAELRENEIAADIKLARQG